MRICGECTWCCYFMNIPEYDSPCNEYCKHCIVNEGCLIPDNRKEVCLKFECLWLMEPNIPGKLRPDRCGVMFELPYKSKVIIGYTDPENPECYQEPLVLILIKKLMEAGYPVLISTDGRKKTFMPEGWTPEDVKKDILATYERHYP